MFYWNTIGFLGLFVGIGVSVVTGGLVASQIGESQFTKGIGFILGSIAMITLDLTIRLRHNKDHGISRLFYGEYGGVAIFPMWCFALIGVAGGVMLILSGD